MASVETRRSFQTMSVYMCVCVGYMVDLLMEYMVDNGSLKVLHVIRYKSSQASDFRFSCYKYGVRHRSVWHRVLRGTTIQVL